jgi:pyruvate dehydrogenase E2 component (dihydrolipoamide acetyltransferase)
MANLKAFTMPKWGIEMSEGTIAEWMVAEGAPFKRGTMLTLIETDKITNEVEAEAEGCFVRLVGEAGETYPVGALLAVLGDPGTDTAEIDAFVGSFKAVDASFAGMGKDEPKDEPAPVAVKTEAAAAAPADTTMISPAAHAAALAAGLDPAAITGTGRGGRISLQDVHQAARPAPNLALKGPHDLQTESAAFASPMARRLAARHGVDLAGIKGTGPRGRISKDDVLALVPAPAAAAPVAFGAPFALVANSPRVVPFDKVRKVVARRLTEAKQQLPHFYLRIAARADELIALRATANMVLGIKASLNDYVVKAAALALARHPDVNVQVHGEAVHSFAHADVAIAVASPKGLVTPVVRQADRMHIAQIAVATRALIDKAQAGRLSFEDMDGGTFAVSNLGMFGIEQFDAIINPPQGAILAVGAITRQPVELAGGDFAFESRIALTLSVDHRAIDGAAGAQFLQTLKGLIEAPEGLFQ